LEVYLQDKFLELGLLGQRIVYVSLLDVFQFTSIVVMPLCISTSSGMGNDWNYIVMKIAQFYEYAKALNFVFFQRMNFMLYELDLKKVNGKTNKQKATREKRKIIRKLVVLPPQQVVGAVRECNSIF
jgi:hypothetical protein